MGCFCDTDYAWYVVQEKWAIARKKHNCIECRKEIKPGEKFRNVVGQDVKRYALACYPTCELCAIIRDDLNNNYGYCILYGQLWEFVDEEFEPPEPARG